MNGSAFYGFAKFSITFQRINTLFASVIGNVLSLYLDDLIVISKDLHSHFEKLSLVFQKLSQAVVL